MTMAKRSLPRQKAESSQLVSAALVQARAQAATKQLMPIKAQLRVLVAASQSIEDASSDVEQCHLTTVLEELIEPCERLFELIDQISLCRPANAEEKEKVEQIERTKREMAGARS
jgi:hypothetical protein